MLRRLLDEYADLTARLVTWRGMLGIIGVALFALSMQTLGDRIGPDGPHTLEQWGDLARPFVLLAAWFAFLIYLRNRHDFLRYHRDAGIDPYDKAAVKAEEERIAKDLRDRGIM